MIHFHIITLFPEAFESYFGSSMLKRAQEDKKIKISFYNPRDFTRDKNRRVDQRPYGGGPGMVLEAEPVLKAIESIKKKIEKRNVRKMSAGKLKKGSKNTMIYHSVKSSVKTIVFVPSGKQFDTATAKKFAKSYTDIVMIAGHYEGVDERVAKITRAEKISIGSYVLTGGELPAMIIADAVSRFIPGVLGKYESLEDERVASSEVYTRPEVLKWKNKNYKVPKVLLSGHHAEITNWKMAKSSSRKRR